MMDGKCVKSVLEWLGYEVEWKLWFDSSAAKAMVLRDGIGKVKHLDVRALWLQAERAKNGLIVRQVAGEKNPSDLGTKAHPVARFILLRKMCGSVDCEEVAHHPDTAVAAVGLSVVSGGVRSLPSPQLGKQYTARPDDWPTGASEAPHMGWASAIGQLRPREPVPEALMPALWSPD